jgi:hypothetical protein
METSTINSKSFGAGFPENPTVHSPSSFPHNKIRMRAQVFTPFFKRLLVILVLLVNVTGMDVTMLEPPSEVSGMNS